MPADIVIYAIIAAGLVLWLRSILGTRHGEERERPNPFARSEKQTGQDSAVGPAAALAPPGAGTSSEARSEAEIIRAGLARSQTLAPAAEAGIIEVVRADRFFILSEFLAGAQEAFVMIVEAFASGDKRTLQDLLSHALYDAFSAEIDARRARGETAMTEIHAVRKTDVTDAQIRDGIAYITVRFTADETKIVRDADDKVISGNPDRISESVDIWTFGRSLKSRDPAWPVYQTRAEEAA